MNLRFACPHCGKARNYEVDENNEEFSELKCPECEESFLFKFGGAEFAKKEEG